VRILLDTHFLIWLAKTPEVITDRELAVMAGRDGPLIVSAITLWELRMKWASLDRHGRPRGELSAEAGLAFAEHNDFTLAPLTPVDCVTTLRDPLDHTDPFDQMLIVHAQQLGAKLLTRDRLLLGHPLTVQL
jgi:PIN domain nuclease of toxin-antitoxin system